MLLLKYGFLTIENLLSTQEHRKGLTDHFVLVRFYQIPSYWKVLYINPSVSSHFSLKQHVILVISPSLLPGNNTAMGHPWALHGHPVPHPFVRASRNCRDQSVGQSGSPARHHTFRPFGDEHHRCSQRDFRRNRLFQWIGLLRNLQETIDFTIKYGAFL